ncbi:MAG: glycosyltransferase [Candidatus Latescibacteria bacterium]|nr:glycosyltransferase [Candidatus Latescibacterota bacterium]NIM64461.1 glycosyltransferase [Candidatus Latescibacterota bacterium]NIO00614.1 glycosyltransferase [Candidatus Latescibacterota bacterium]NIO27015.1 glycosyltransferase [Candidatus Latescibacterota bacterium]NIO56092.1 glycosyltransferase [Candidatus Latescibacterota bacterium]
MSVYNGERYVREAIETILSQTFTDFEFLIINDGSTDSSREIVLSYDDQRIRFLENPENIGLTKSLNRGLGEARGTWIVRTDADDWNDPHRLAAQIDLAENHQLDVCFCNLRVVSGGKPDYLIEYSAWPWIMKRWLGLFWNAYGGHPTSCFKRESILTLGGYDDRFRCAQDYDLWDRCVEAGFRFGYVPETLVRRNVHDQCISKRFPEEQTNTLEHVSLRAMRRIWPQLSDEEAESIKWILRWDSTEKADRSHALGFRLCKEFIRRYTRHASPQDIPVVWELVASSLHLRLRKLSTFGDIMRAVRLWGEAVLRAKGRYRLPVGRTIRWLFKR